MDWVSYERSTGGQWRSVQEGTSTCLQYLEQRRRLRVAGSEASGSSARELLNRPMLVRRFLAWLQVDQHVVVVALKVDLPHLFEAEDVPELQVVGACL